MKYSTLSKIALAVAVTAACAWADNYTLFDVNEDNTIANFRRARSVENEQRAQAMAEQVREYTYQTPRDLVDTVIESYTNELNEVETFTNDVYAAVDSKYWIFANGEIEALDQAGRDAVDAAELAAWQSSGQYITLATAQQVIAGIQGTLAGLGVTPADKAQVFADVRALVMGATPGTAEQDTLLRSSLDLFTMYAKLEELIGSTEGYINGSRTIDLTMP